MANTTNFGWETPDDTDLVKDGAAAMRTLGNSIDASFVDLKGGTTGQILSKNSNTDLDFTWIANDQGDITSVTAGVGLTGGGTAGGVTLTNDMATTITAAGDIVVGTGSSTYDNLPIGTTGQVLTADTTVSPYKVKWDTLPSADWTFSAWTPTYTGLTVGNGTVTARYAQKGKLVVAWWKLLFGSTTSCTGITVSTPVNPYTDYAYSTIVEAQAGNVNYIMSTSALSNKWYLRAIDTSGSYAKIQGMNATTPGTWSSASGDYIALVSVYEAA